MKKYFLVLVVVPLLTFAACGTKETAEAPSGSKAETLDVAEGESLWGQEPEGEGKTEAAESMPGEDTQEPETEESAEEGLILTGAPSIYLSDVLSSTLNRTELHSGNYSWSYVEEGETVSMVACGTHPLDDNSSGADKLKLPEYNGIDFVSYLVSCEASPDSILVREWDVSEEGNTQADPESETAYEEALIIDLKPDKIYEIVAVWKEEMLAERGFCGEASYEVRTIK